MNVFISYSVDDTDLVRKVADSIHSKATVNYWDESQHPGMEVWPTIHGWIDSADLVLVLITDKTLERALSVGHEVGRATKAGKQVIPLVAKGVPNEALGFLAGITYIRIDPEEPNEAIQRLHSELQRVSQEMQLKQKRKQEEKNKVVAAASIAFLLFLFTRD